MRLFVAIALPEETRADLAALQEGIPGARWIPAENLHLTLHFIGEVDGHQARDLDAALAAVRMPGFPVALAGVGQFGGGAKLRALWAGVAPSEPLMRLQTKVAQAVRGAGVASNGRKFKPHVTLARFKAGAGANGEARVRDYLWRHGLFRAAPFAAEDFVLYSSFLGQGGAIYQAEAEYPLARLPAAAPPPTATPTPGA